MGLLLRLLASFNHAEQLADPADQKPLLLDLYPDPRRGRKDNVVAWRDGHLHTGRLPPVNAEANRQDDSVLGGWFVIAWRYQQAGAAEPFRFQFLDHDSVEERSELLTHGSIVGQWFFAATDAYISGSRWRSRGSIRQMAS